VCVTGCFLSEPCREVGGELLERARPFIDIFVIGSRVDLLKQLIVEASPNLFESALL
jgi:hypothetical protein